MTRSTTDTAQRDTTTTPEDHEQVPLALDPSAELIGCLLQSTPAHVAEILTYVNDEDPTTEIARQVLALIRTLTQQGIHPTPVAVFAHARTTGVVTREDAIKRLAHYILDCYHNATRGPVYASYIAIAVVENAYRRAGTEHAIRIQQAVEKSGLAGYEQVLGDREALRDLWRRVRLAHGGDVTDTSTVTSPDAPQAVGAA